MRAWLILLLLPTAGALGIDNPSESTPVTLYPHLIGMADLPINTEAPPASWRESSSLGIASHSQGCVDTPGLGLASSTYHSFYGYSYPAHIEYGGEPNVGPARGLRADLAVDGLVAPTLHWFMETNPAQAPSAEAPLAQVVVTATIREGDAISVNHEAMNKGRILAFGQSEPAVLAGTATQGATYDDGIYGFELVLPWATNEIIIPEAVGYNLRVDMRIDVPGCNDSANEQYVMPDVVSIHSSHAHRPRLELAIFNPIVISSVSSQVHNGTATFTAQVTTPWGAYNLDRPVLNVTTTPDDLQQTIQTPDARFGAPLTSFWTWTPEGNVTASMEVFDLQGNGPAFGTLPLEVGARTTTCQAALHQEALCNTQVHDKKSPTPFVGLVLLLLIGLGIALRANKP